MVRSSRWSECLALLVGVLAVACSPAQKPGEGWPTYGGDPGGTRFTTAHQITPANVSQLQTAWTYHTGVITKYPGQHLSMSFEATPILFHDMLFVGTPFDEIVALNPATGEQIWKYDPHLQIDPAELYTTRGVAAWPLESAGKSQATGPCAARIFVATLDRRLIAVDAADGKPCADFGDHGAVDLSRDVSFVSPDRYGVTSPPTVIGDVVVVGSKVPDNQRVNIESGLVRAYDVRSGKQIWSWEPLPWAKSQKLRTGAGNTWAAIAADPEHNLVFLPTGAPSPDFYGGTRPGDNRDANSVVALEATTGRRVWGFQVVHHDVWDYDVAAEPLLFTFRGNVPAIAISTKQGLVFLLNRLTGEPLFPIEERPVPKSDVPGEQLSPTQPFQRIDSVSPLTLDWDKQLGATPEEDKACRAMLKTLRYDGIYTPPSFQGSLTFPGNLGGVNWGSAAFDPATGILYANTNRYAYSLTVQPRLPAWRLRLMKIVKHPEVRFLAVVICLGAAILFVAMLWRRSLFPGAAATTVCCVLLLAGLVHAVQIRHANQPGKIKVAEHFGRELALNVGARYLVERVPLIAPGTGNPCVPQPWGTVSALNLNTGKAVWQSPLGTTGAGQPTGTINLGGDVVTAGGLLFTGATEDPYLRAFDVSSGQELAKWPLPAPAQATPMSYTYKGRQYVVIAAGGHSLFGTPLADTLVAYALPTP